MLRNSMIGAVAFGLAATVAGYIWTAFEFPFAILLTASVGWYAVTATTFGARKAWQAALIGGVSFTAAFLVAVFFALTDGSPIALTAWASATLAAAAAGAATGWLFDHMHGALSLAGFSAAGMLAAVVVAGLMRYFAPAGVDVEGQAQFLYFALVQGVIGVFVGAAIGAGTAWLKDHPGTRPSTPSAHAGEAGHA